MIQRPVFPLLLVVIHLSCSVLAFGQRQGGRQGSNQGSRRGHLSEMHEEKPDDPYLPNADQNLRTSPAYHDEGEGLSKTAGVQVFTRQVNVNATGQNMLGDAANEPSIAVNPLDENFIAIGWRQFDNVTSNFRQAGWGYSDDGGQSWHFPGVLEPGAFRSDPVLDFDQAGNFYYNSMLVQPDYFCKVFQSTNGGAAWDTGTDAGGGDKQWMAIDRTSGVGEGNIYATWTSGYSTCFPDQFTRSTDDNGSYEACTSVNGEPYWGTMAVGNNGNLYIGGMSANLGPMVVKSSNAQVPGSLISWDAAVPVNMDGAPTGWISVNPEGLLGQMNIDVDRSGLGNVYLLASLTRYSNPDLGDVMFARSTDGGLTWAAPIRVNDDPSEYNVQWLATMSVAPNGRIDAAWLDTRNRLLSDSSALYYAYSTDQGNTWFANEQISPVFDPHLGYPNQNKMGDYFDMVSTNSGAHLAWASTLNGEQDVYYSFIVPDFLIAAEETSPMVDFTIFPNPSDGELVVQTPRNGSRMVLCNLLGEEVYATILHSGNTEIDLGSFPAGMYFVRVVGRDGHSGVRKLTIEH